MKNYLLLFSLLIFPLQSFAAVQPSGIPYRAIGGTNTIAPNIFIPDSDISWFTLYVATGTTTGGNFYPFWKDGSQYRVGSGKTCMCSFWEYDEDSTGDGMQLVHSLTAWAYNDSSLTSGVYQTGATTRYIQYSDGAGAISYSFPSLAYPGVQWSGTTKIMVRLHCREI